MKILKKIFNYIFVDGLSGMALGLFGTLIIGTIFEQIGNLIDNRAGSYILLIAAVAKSLTGAGIGAGMAFKYKATPLTGVSAAVAGMVGAFAAKLLAHGLRLVRRRNLYRTVLDDFALVRGDVQLLDGVPSS